MSLKRKATSSLSEPSAKQADIPATIDVWTRIANYLPIADLLSLRHISQRFRTLGENRIWIRRLSRCIDADGDIDIETPLEVDDLDLYKSIGVLPGSSFERELIYSIVYQARRCYDFFLPRVANIAAVNMINICWEGSGIPSPRDREFDMRVLIDLRRKNELIAAEFAIHLNLPLEVKLCALQCVLSGNGFIESQVARMIHTGSQSKLACVLLARGVSPKSCNGYLFVKSGSDPELETALVERGYKINHTMESCRPESSPTSLHNLALDVLRRKLPRAIKGPACEFSFWPYLRHLHITQPITAEMILSRLTSVLIVSDREVHLEGLTILTKLLDEKQLDEKELGFIYRFYTVSKDSDLSIWHALWQAGGKAFLNKYMKVWGEETGQLWRALYLSDNVIDFTPEDLEQAFAEDDVTSYERSFIVRYLASRQTSWLLEKMLAMRREIFHTLMAYYTGAPISARLYTEAMRVKTQRWALVVEGIADYDGSVLQYIQHRRNAPRMSIFRQMKFK